MFRNNLKHLTNIKISELYGPKNLVIKNPIRTNTQNPIIKETYEHFNSLFHPFFKESKEPLIPNLNKNKFQECLEEKNIVEILKIKNSKELINLITDFNNQPVDETLYTLTQMKKCKEHGFYLGLYQNYNWIDEIIGTIRKKFSKSVRAKVWSQVIGIKHGTAKCPCCNNLEINQLNFEIGHKISKRKGGSDALENLSPICSVCNKSMTTINFDDFKKSLN